MSRLDRKWFEQTVPRVQCPFPYMQPYVRTLLQHDTFSFLPAFKETRAKQKSSTYSVSPKPFVWRTFTSVFWQTLSGFLVCLVCLMVLLGRCLLGGICPWEWPGAGRPGTAMGCHGPNQPPAPSSSASDMEAWELHRPELQQHWWKATAQLLAAKKWDCWLCTAQEHSACWEAPVIFRWSSDHYCHCYWQAIDFPQTAMQSQKAFCFI